MHARRPCLRAFLTIDALPPRHALAIHALIAIVPTSWRAAPGFVPPCFIGGPRQDFLARCTDETLTTHPAHARDHPRNACTHPAHARDHPRDARTHPAHARDHPRRRPRHRPFDIRTGSRDQRHHDGAICSHSRREPASFDLPIFSSSCSLALSHPHRLSSRETRRTGAASTEPLRRGQAATPSRLRSSPGAMLSAPCGRPSRLLRPAVRAPRGLRAGLDGGADAA
jgi:hypothetical protein